jgi:large subunit ribosomal protein L18
MKSKKAARLKRAKRSRAKIAELQVPSITVHKTSQHIYAQVKAADGASTLASASSLDKALKGSKTGNIESATAVGKLLAERAKAAGIEKVAFDRSGFKFHGRVKALADAAREGGMIF